MIVTKAVIVPTTDRVDESRLIQTAYKLCQVLLWWWRNGLLAPAFIVDDLEGLDT